MNQIGTAVVVGASTVLLYDLVASLISRRFGIPYGRFSPGSFAVYAVTGSAAVQPGGLASAALAGLVVALIEATIGWALSWRLGPGRPPPERRNASSISTAIAVVTMTGAIVGAIGGALYRGFR
ncbi:MAG TPA: hypothetical protein VFG66_04910 [Gemmatimonadales bacterium]|nr:hypothetical protein [Gemmatimonadales bacterium]